MQPSPKQSACIWKFCVKFCSAGHSHEEWNNMGRRGQIDKFAAMALIGKLKSFEGNPTPDGKKDVEIALGVFIPGIKIVSNPFPDGPDNPGKGKEEGEGGEGKKGEGKAPDLDADGGKVKDLLQQLEEELEKKIKKKKPAPEIPQFDLSEDYIMPKEFPEIINIIQAKENPLLTGPRGCGKSRLGREVAKALKKEGGCFTISFGGSMRYPQVFGGTQLTGDGKSEWKPAPLLEAIQKPCVVVIDEIFSCEGDVTNGLNSLLEAGTRSIMTPNGEIKMHPECVIIGTANANGRAVDNTYTGVNVQDASLLDRFIECPVDYDIRVEQKLVTKLEDPDVEETLISKLRKLRDRIKENMIFFDASTRKMISCIKLIAGGTSPDRAFELAYLVGLSRTERTKIGM
jgi:MoxR-like ATPase